MSGTTRAQKDDALSAPSPIPSATEGAGRSRRIAGAILALAVLAGAIMVPVLLLAGGAVRTAEALGLLAILALGGLALGLGLRLGRVERARAALEARLFATEAARLKAEEDSRAKSRFLAEMSHELRTPLNTVMGFSEMMAEEVLGPHRVPAYQGYARDIHACGGHLLALADDLLDLARIESGHRVLLETPVRLDLLIQDCLAMMAPQARARGVALRDGGAPPLLRLWGDERALKQMALNLLANAVKFTPKGGEVRLSCGLDGEGAPVLSVEDTGRGLAERELPLGDARHQESRLDLATGKGAGLGLAIVEGLARLHGARLTLARRPGGGTIATVVFPVARASLAPDARPARSAA